MKIYVDGKSGDDTAAGTQAAPLRTLAEAQRRAREIDPYPSIVVKNSGTPGTADDAGKPGKAGGSSDAGTMGDAGNPGGRATRPPYDEEPGSGGEEDFAASL